MFNVPLFLEGQLKSGDSTSNIFVSKDTVTTENILKTPDLQIEETQESVSSRPPLIPMPVPGMERYDFLMPPRYWGYENAKNMFRYTEPGFETGKLNLNLNLSPPKSFFELIRENPSRALLYGTAILAGRANNTIVGEDKMNLIRLDNMVQSRSGIPESAISGQGKIYYGIEIKKHK
jgi:hypothetical protein